MTIRKVIQKELEIRDWSIYRLAKETGIYQTTLANFLIRNSQLGSDKLDTICRVLGLTLNCKK